MYKSPLYVLDLLQKNTKKRFLVFKTQGFYYQELVFCKLVNLQKPSYYDESLDEKLSWKLQARNQEFFGAE